MAVNEIMSDLRKEFVDACPSDVLNTKSLGSKVYKIKYAQIAGLLQKFAWNALFWEHTTPYQEQIHHIYEAFSKGAGDMLVEMLIFAKIADDAIIKESGKNGKYFESLENAAQYYPSLMSEELKMAYEHKQAQEIVHSIFYKFTAWRASRQGEETKDAANMAKVINGMEDIMTEYIVFMNMCIDSDSSPLKELSAPPPYLIQISFTNSWVEKYHNIRQDRGSTLGVALRDMFGMIMIENVFVSFLVTLINMCGELKLDENAIETLKKEGLTPSKLKGGEEGPNFTLHFASVMDGNRHVRRDEDLHSIMNLYQLEELLNIIIESGTRLPLSQFDDFLKAMRSGVVRFLSNISKSVVSTSNFIREGVDSMCEGIFKLPMESLKKGTQLEFGALERYNKKTIENSTSKLIIKWRNMVAESTTSSHEISSSNYLHLA